MNGPHASGPGYEFDHPGAIASDATHVWVANQGNNTVTELSASTGALVKVLSGPRYKFFSPDAIASDGRHVWVANEGFPFSGNVTELSASTGALVKVLNGFKQPDAIASDGKHVWVVNANNLNDAQGGGSVTELSASTGAPVKVLSGPSYDFDGAPYTIASDGKHVWVTNYGGGGANPSGMFGVGSVTELSPSTGAVVRVLNGMSYSKSAAGYSEAAPERSDVFSAVSVKWPVPTVTCPPGANTFAQQGPDISGVKGVVADGTFEFCGSSGTPQYSAWCEPYPYGGQGLTCDLPDYKALPYPVSPGDAIAAAVGISGATLTLSMADTTKGWTWSSTIPNGGLPGVNQIASVTVEKQPQLGLADFGAVDFTGATAELDGKTRPLTAVAPERAFWMINGSTPLRSTLLAAPGPLDPEGDFTVTWYAN